MFSPRPQAPVTKTTSRKPEFGVEREDHAARREIRADHLHHADRQRDLEVVEAVVDAIDDGAVGEDRGKAAPAGLEQIGLAAHIQKALMLAGEAGGRQVFGGRRAAHGNRDPGAAFFFEGAIGRGDFRTEMRIAGRLVNQPAGGNGALGEQCHIVVVECGEKPAQLVLDAGPGERVAIGPSGQREALGHSDPLGCEHRIKLAERRVLAANFGDVAQPDFTEPADI